MVYKILDRFYFLVIQKNVKKRKGVYLLFFKKFLVNKNNHVKKYIFIFNNIVKKCKNILTKKGFWNQNKIGSQLKFSNFCFLPESIS